MPHFFRSIYKVGVDLHLPYLREAKARRLYEDLIYGDVRHLPFKYKSFDTILCIDLIEHLERCEGERLLNEMEKIARRQIFVFTPVGFLPQMAFDTPLQTNRSAWKTSDFNMRGYKVRGINGLFFLRGERASFRFKGVLSFFSMILSHSSQVLVYLFPKLAFQMLCIKNVGDKKFGRADSYNSHVIKNEEKLNGEALVFIDLDFTIVDGNTTFDFLKFVNPRRYHIFSRILMPIIFLNKLFKKDVYKVLLVLLCIKGKPKELLQRYSRKYYTYIEKNDRYINRALMEYLANFHKKILITASLDIVAENFKDLGFNIIVSSKTYYKNGKFQYFVDLYGKKHEFLQYLSKRYNKIIVIEDSPEQEYYKIDNVKIISPKHICSI
jgi:hypothetical protein